MSSEGLPKGDWIVTHCASSNPSKSYRPVPPMMPMVVWGCSANVGLLLMTDVSSVDLVESFTIRILSVVDVVGDSLSRDGGTVDAAGLNPAAR